MLVKIRDLALARAQANSFKSQTAREARRKEKGGSLKV
jgi:hypothetical protein